MTMTTPLPSKMLIVYKTFSNNNIQINGNMAMGVKMNVKKHVPRISETRGQGYKSGANHGVPD
jgi:hypothetical protein